MPGRHHGWSAHRPRRDWQKLDRRTHRFSHAFLAHDRLREQRQFDIGRFGRRFLAGIDRQDKRRHENEESIGNDFRGLRAEQFADDRKIAKYGQFTHSFIGPSSPAAIEDDGLSVRASDELVHAASGEAGLLDELGEWNRLALRPALENWRDRRLNGKQRSRWAVQFRLLCSEVHDDRLAIRRHRRDDRHVKPSREQFIVGDDNALATHLCCMHIRDECMIILDGNRG